MGEFGGNIALITGDNSGIDLATAKQCDRSHSSSCADTMAVRNALDEGMQPQATQIVAHPALGVMGGSRPSS